MHLASILDALAQVRVQPIEEVVCSPKTLMELLHAIGEDSRLHLAAVIPGSTQPGFLFGIPIRHSTQVPDGELYIFDKGGGIRSLISPAIPANPQARKAPESPYGLVAYIKRNTLEAMDKNDTYLFTLNKSGAEALHARGVPYRD